MKENIYIKRCWYFKIQCIGGAERDTLKGGEEEEETIMGYKKGAEQRVDGEG